MNGLKLSKTKDGVFIIENVAQTNAPNQFSNVANASFQSKGHAQGDVVVKDSLITVDVISYPIIEIINQSSGQLGVNYILFSDVTGNTSAKVSKVTYEELLSFLFQGTNFTYKKKSGVYLIGQRNLEGFRSTELIKLDFRTTEGIEKEIPTELLKDVELKVHKELNALILTGNKQKIDEVATFIKLVDRPIPNILIEVIVVDVRKGYSIETGLKAFISPDSVPKTQGQVFPGIDVTLSSKAVNDVLSQLDSKGIVNLGRVTPKFYAQLQAMEQNNNIQVRSTPKLSTMNGSKANLVMGESVYYVETTQSVSTGVSPLTTVTQRFNKVEANLSINISPIVSGNEHITLDITAEFSDFIVPTIQNAPPGNTTRKFESKIRVKNEEMIILGGLEEQSKSDTGTGVPFLSRIPILKWIFSSKSKRTTNNRLIVFIKPTLVY
jgi:type IV pilus assembly protein PilQ